MPNQADDNLLPMVPKDHGHDGCNCDGKCKTCKCGRRHRKSQTPS